MVVVQLAGGLGNQMFQYAAGRALAQQWQTTLKLDLSYFDGQDLRAYSLGGFKLQPQFATHTEVAWLTGKHLRRLARWRYRLAQALRPPGQRAVVTEQHYLHYQPELFGSARDVYLAGYWQNARYFETQGEHLRDEFRPAGKLWPDHQALNEAIAAGCAVGVHVRRGDYVSDVSTNQVHGVCSPDYYGACARALLAQLPEAHFFVFSDDIGWAHKYLALGGPMTFAAQPPAERDFEQLVLLSRCRHLILANSTFSWWGAWLGEHDGQIVYAPKRWFSTDQYDTSDFIPAHWRRL
jgi:hypothetical protein